MAGVLIDGRPRFTVARCAAIARRQTLSSDTVQCEWLEAELRAAMSTGTTLWNPIDGTVRDLDGRIIE